MIRFIARRVAKLQYRFKLEVEAESNSINAQLAANRAKEKRAYIDQLNREADDIEKGIVDYAGKEEKGYWVCECGKENTNVPAVPQDQGHQITCKCGKAMKLVKRDQMTPDEIAQSDKERDEAKTIAAEKRKAAEQEATNVTEGEKTAEYFRGMAANSRTVADKIKSL